MSSESAAKRAKLGEEGAQGSEQQSGSAQSLQQPAQLKNGELSTGRPRYKPDERRFETAGGVAVERTVTDLSASIEADVDTLLEALDSRRGCIFESAYEYPGRYARWTMGFCDPPLSLEGWGRRFRLTALNARGRVLLLCFEQPLRACAAVVASELQVTTMQIDGRVEELAAGARFSEEERSKQSSVFSVIRSIIALWRTSTEVDPQLGLYGALGYDLTFQFEAVKLKHERDAEQRDLLLYLPDSILVHDKQSSLSWRLDYDFTVTDAEGNKHSTAGLPREGASEPYQGAAAADQDGDGGVAASRDHEPGEYARSVEKAREEFKVGNLFECVLSQTFMQPCSARPSEVLRMLRLKNPSPYMFVINLGQKEYLVGASPEMFVRVEKTVQGLRVETCPISGTIRRGENALEDAERIREILVNRKEESELTMCTDVDRNDKSRICRQGSVQVIGRRQIEKYSKLIHTVDHVEGYLREGFDALDAFLGHTWAVTVTGAPKVWAIQFVEKNEKSPRCWYGGAVGLLGFDGSLNTGMTLRTIRIKDGVAEVRAGATLLYDSVPADEEAETELKASAFREAVLNASVIARAAADPAAAAAAAAAAEAKAKANGTAGVGPCHTLSAGVGKTVVLIDHQDSFVHTLANYLRQTGASVSTVRCGIAKADLAAMRPDLVVMSPGPGKPSDFACADTLRMLEDLKVPVFGVCLGLQSMVERFGSTLDVLGYPMHGKPSIVEQVLPADESKWKLLQGLGPTFAVARYHSLFAQRASIEKNPDLNILAQLEDGTVMAIEHKTLPMAAVQFHPESILTRPADGLAILSNALRFLSYAPDAPSQD